MTEADDDLRTDVDDGEKPDGDSDCAVEAGICAGVQDFGGTAGESAAAARHLAPELDPVHASAVVNRKRAREEAKREELRRLEDEVYEESAAILRGALDFYRIDPEQPAPPPEWVEELGEERAMLKLRLARAGWASSKEAPIALRLAEHAFVGIARARALERSPIAFNMVFVKMPSPSGALEESEVSE